MITVSIPTKEHNGLFIIVGKLSELSNSQIKLMELMSDSGYLVFVSDDNVMNARTVAKYLEG